MKSLAPHFVLAKNQFSPRVISFRFAGLESDEGLEQCFKRQHGTYDGFSYSVYRR